MEQSLDFVKTVVTSLCTYFYYYYYLVFLTSSRPSLSLSSPFCFVVPVKTLKNELKKNFVRR